MQVLTSCEILDFKPFIHFFLSILRQSLFYCILFPTPCGSDVDRVDNIIMKLEASLAILALFFLFILA